MIGALLWLKYRFPISGFAAIVSFDLNHNMNNSQRLQQLLDRISLQMFVPISLQSLSIYFSTPDIIMHLKKLGIPQLKNRLVWIPPDRFTEIEYLGEGGFAKVYKGTANGYVYALKELKKNMLPEVSITNFTLYNVYFCLLPSILILQ